MNLLATALPGIRDVRAPLVAGYLWLLLAYFIVEPGRDFENVHGTTANIVDLAHTAGPFATAVAVSVAAFFIGALSQPIAVALAAGIRRAIAPRGHRFNIPDDWIPRMRPELTVRERSEAHESDTIRSLTWRGLIAGRSADGLLDANREALEATRKQFEAIKGDAAKSSITQAAAAYKVYEGRLVSGQEVESHEFTAGKKQMLLWLDRGLVRAAWDNTALGTRRLDEVIVRAEDLWSAKLVADRKEQIWAVLVARTRDLATEAEKQLDISATLIVGHEALPFSHADRERAEAEMRIGTFLPLTALAIYLVPTVSGWWGLLALAALALAWQGLLREDAARRMIVDTIIHKNVPFTPFDKFREAVETAERDVAAATGGQISAAPS